MKKVKIKNFLVGKGEPLTVISGPCVIESEQAAFEAAVFLKNLLEPMGINFIYKSSYDKANRSSIDSFRGPGMEEGLKILKRIQTELNIPVLTDVHSPEEAEIVGSICDVIQIPAFLCRQTDLIVAAGKSKAVVNVKKGQFMSPWEMGNVVDKLVSAGTEKILLTDRGTSFGYNNLVSDMRAIPVMQKFGFPVCFDASHSVMLPGGLGHISGGQREFIPTLSKAAIAAGCNALFLESHPNPAEAKSDKETVFPFSQMEEFISQLLTIYRAVHVF